MVGYPRYKEVPTLKPLLSSGFYCQKRGLCYKHRPLRFNRAFTLSYMLFMALTSKPMLQVLV